MRYYFDESGDFRLDDDGIPRVGIVVGIAIPESVESVVFASFDAFIATLSTSAFKNGEPKGNLLSLEERTRFAQLFADNNTIVVSPALLDIPSINRAGRPVQDDVVRRLRKSAEQSLHETIRSEVHLLANQFNNLSHNQCIRLHSLAYCIRRAFEQTIILLSGRKYFNDWHAMRFEIDAVGERQGNREELVFRNLMLIWLQSWSRKEPTMTITEIHTDDHPLIQNYSTRNDKFDLNKIYQGNIFYGCSSDSKGLQIADMAASIIHHALCGIVTFDNLMNYGLLLKNNLWAPKYAHGLFSLTDPSDVNYHRYEGLTEAIAKVRGGKEWTDIVSSRLSI